MIPDRLPTLTLPDLSGRRAVVTGATSGIGYHTAIELATAGADVVLAVRNVHKGYAVADKIFRSSLGGRIVVEEIDVAQLASVRAFATRLDDSPIDILINNAGCAPTKTRAASMDGFERTMATNHLGHFALTSLLLPRLKAAKSPRVISVGSIAAKFAKLDPQNLNLEKNYSGSTAYANSKLAVLLFSQELHRRSLRLGWGIDSMAAHPGWAATALFSSARSTEFFSPSKAVNKLVAKMPLQQSAGDGAQPILYAAASEAAVTGSYYGPAGKWGMAGKPRRISLPEKALDHDLARDLWRVSESLTNQSFEE